MTTQKQLVTFAELAEILRTKPRTLRRYLYRGQIPFIKFGPQYRFDPDEVIEALKAQSEPIRRQFLENAK